MNKIKRLRHAAGHAKQDSASASARSREQFDEVESKIRRLVDALASGLMGNNTVTALHEAENERDLLTARLSAATEATPIDLRATLDNAASEFARMIDELPQHLNHRETVNDARDALREWLGGFRIEPPNDGPLLSGV